MSDVTALITRCRALSAEFLSTPDGKLKVRAPQPLPDKLRQELKGQKQEILAVLAHEALPFCDASRLGRRDFLPRPLDQEENPDVWDAWVPLFDWLVEHHPDHFYAVCEAEEYIRTLERTGITGAEYQSACQELLKRFEAARQLKKEAGFTKSLH